MGVEEGLRALSKRELLGVSVTFSTGRGKDNLSGFRPLDPSILSFLFLLWETTHRVIFSPEGPLT